MRISRISSGLAVLLTTLAFAHLLHHFFANALPDAVRSPAFWAGFIIAAGVGILSFIGGCLLLKQSA